MTVELVLDRYTGETKTLNDVIESIIDNEFKNYLDEGHLSYTPNMTIELVHDIVIDDLEFYLDTYEYELIK